MTLRRRVQTVLQSLLRGRPHQGLRVGLAHELVPAAVQDAARAVLLHPESYAERVDGEAERLFPALTAWCTALTDVEWPFDGVPDEQVDWRGDAWHLVPTPEPSQLVLQEAERAVRAAGAPAVDELERDALMVSAYAGHLALNLARSMHDLEREAARLRR